MVEWNILKNSLKIRQLSQLYWNNMTSLNVIVYSMSIYSNNNHIVQMLRFEQGVYHLYPILFD